MMLRDWWKRARWLHLPAQRSKSDRMLWIAQVFVIACWGYAAVTWAADGGLTQPLLMLGLIYYPTRFTYSLVANLVLGDRLLHAELGAVPRPESHMSMAELEATMEVATADYAEIRAKIDRGYYCGR